VVDAESIVWFVSALPALGIGAYLGHHVERDEVALVHQLGGVAEQVEGPHALDAAEARLAEKGAQDIVREAHLRNERVHSGSASGTGNTVRCDRARRPQTVASRRDQRVCNKETDMPETVFVHSPCGNQRHRTGRRRSCASPATGRPARSSDPAASCVKEWCECNLLHAHCLGQRDV
jgi:hypothetical protein